MIEGFDSEQAMSFFDNNKDFYNELLVLYYNDILKRKKELNKSMVTKDVKSFVLHIHSIKSSSETVGMNYLYKKSKKLEMLVQSENFESIAKDFDLFMLDIDKMIDNLKIYLKKYNLV